MVYFMDGITGVDTLAAQRKLSDQLIFKLKRECSRLCGFVWARVSLEIVRSNSLLLHGP